MTIIAYRTIDGHTKQVLIERPVGHLTDEQRRAVRARMNRTAERHNLTYGAHRYYVQPVWESNGH